MENEKFDIDYLDQLSQIYNNLLGRDRLTQNGINALDLLEDLVYNEVLKRHDEVFPPIQETTPEAQQEQE